MTCLLYKEGKMKPRLASVVLNRGERADVIGEYFRDKAATRIVYARAEEESATGKEVAVGKFQVA